MRQEIAWNLQEILAVKSRDLFRAISDNDHGSVALLLQEFSQLRSATNQQGAFPLHMVASSPLADVLMAQIVLGGDVDSVHFDTFQNTPFVVACICGRVDLAHFFAEQNYATYFRDILGNSPLHYAYFWGDDLLVQKLVSVGVDQELKNKAGYTPFEVGKYYHPNLPLYEGSVISKVDAALAQAADVGIVEVEKNTAEARQEETQTSAYLQKMTSLAGMTKASKAAAPKVTDEEKQESRERNWMKNAEDEKREFDEAEQKQRKAAADLAEFQNRQREKAVEEERKIADEQRKYLESEKLLQQAFEESQDDPNFDPEWVAASVKDLNYVARNLGAQITFSESSKSLDKKDRSGDSLIHHAISMVTNPENSVEAVISLVKNLVKNGLDVNLRGSGNMTPLARVCSYEGDHVELAKFLLRKGARAEDKTGALAYNSLHLAVVAGNFEITKFLLENCAHDKILNSCSTSGDTALHYACKTGNKEIALLLLDFGADSQIKNNQGKVAVAFMRDVDAKKKVLKKIVSVSPVPSITTLSSNAVAPLAQHSAEHKI